MMEAAKETNTSLSRATKNSKLSLFLIKNTHSVTIYEVQFTGCRKEELSL